MDEQNLYQNIKKKICRMIYENIYQNGDLIPSERKLSEEFGVSRVTIRKALKLLEEEQIIQRVQGSGTRVALQYGAHQGTMDIITLVAPAQNAFFSRFIDSVQTKAEEMDSLVLFKQKPKNISLEKCLYQIYDKDLRNVVLWLEDMELGNDALKKLRGLGMNIVLFDAAFHSDYADSVCLDNREGIRLLVSSMQKAGKTKLGYIGWDDMKISSVKTRQNTFSYLVPDGLIYQVPWKYRNNLEALPSSIIEQGLQKLNKCDGIIYGVGELGLPFERKARELSNDHQAAMIDLLPGSEDLDILTLDQDFTKMAEKIYECLTKQNQRKSNWKACLYEIKGRLSQKI